MFPEAPLALRLSGQLLLGVVRIYSRKVNYLALDSQDTLLKIKNTYRVAGAEGNAVDMPTVDDDGQFLTVTLPENYGQLDFYANQAGLHDVYLTTTGPALPTASAANPAITGSATPAHSGAAASDFEPMLTPFSAGGAGDDEDVDAEKLRRRSSGVSDVDVERLRRDSLASPGVASLPADDDLMLPTPTPRSGAGTARGPDDGEGPAFALDDDALLPMPGGGDDDDLLPSPDNDDGGMPMPFADDDDLLPPPGGDVDDHVNVLPPAGTGTAAEAAQRKQRKPAASRKRRAQVDSASTMPNATIRRNLKDTSFCTLAPPEKRARLGRSASEMRAFVLGTTSSFAPGAMRTASAFVERRNALSSAPVSAAAAAAATPAGGGAPTPGTDDGFAPSPEYDDDAAPLPMGDLDDDMPLPMDNLDDDEQVVAAAVEDAGAAAYLGVEDEQPIGDGDEDAAAGGTVVTKRARVVLAKIVEAQDASPARAAPSRRRGGETPAKTATVDADEILLKAPGVTRRQAAQAFFDLLVLKSKDKIELEQEKAFSHLFVSAR